MLGSWPDYFFSELPVHHSFHRSSFHQCGTLSDLLVFNFHAVLPLSLSRLTMETISRFLIAGYQLHGRGIVGIASRKAGIAVDLKWPRRILSSDSLTVIALPTRNFEVEQQLALTAAIFINGLQILCNIRHFHRWCGERATPFTVMVTCEFPTPIVTVVHRNSLDDWCAYPSRHCRESRLSP